VRIVVCVKQVLDPEIPARAFRIDEGRTDPVVVGMPATLVPDSYAENALELGLQLRDRVDGSTLTALCVGDIASNEVLRRALGLTSDAAVRAWDDGWGDRDALGTSCIIARAIEALGGADLVLCGRQASDIEESLMGPAIAEELGAPCVTVARSVEPTAEGLRIEREADGLVQTVEVPLPAVVTVTSASTNVPRMPKVKDTMLARRKPIRVLGTTELALERERAEPGVRIERLSLPATDGVCEMIGGTSVAAQAAALAGRLREARLL
jgi:electron transfer flavoprotein beta subunit